MATNPASNESLVTVFDTEQESEAMVIHGLLESEGVESVVLSLDAPQDVLPGVGGVVVQVRAEQAEMARDLIQQYRDAAPEVEAEMESELSDEPTEPQG